MAQRRRSALIARVLRRRPEKVVADAVAVEPNERVETAAEWLEDMLVRTDA